MNRAPFDHAFDRLPHRLIKYKHHQSHGRKDQRVFAHRLATSRPFGGFAQPYVETQHDALNHRVSPDNVYEIALTVRFEVMP
jgi:hypothetical protein